MWCVCVCIKAKKIKANKNNDTTLFNVSHPSGFNMPHFVCKCSGNIILIASSIWDHNRWMVSIKQMA